MSDFFNNKQEEKMESTIKIGEREFKQEELAELVGLGETAKEYQDKWNRPIKDFYPDYTQKSQKLAEFERQQADFTKNQEAQKMKELEERSRNDQLSPEEARQVALKQARDLGLLTRDELDDEVNKRVAAVLAGKDLIGDVKTVIEVAKEKGQPQSTVENLLKYMDENGIKNPEKAYKLMYESEIDAWKEEQLKKLRPAGFSTQDSSNPGSKAPPAPPSITKENLAAAIRESLTRSRGI